MATHDEQLCYRLLYKAAEQRYDRMKGMVNNAIEQMRLMEIKDSSMDPMTDSDLRAELAVARQKIIALELECSRLNSSERLFEYEERVREYEDVFNQIVGYEHPETEGLHPKYHPTVQCKSEACQNYARRMRSIFRQSVAEACAKERSARVNGVFQREIEPLEKLRARKDAEILELRLKAGGNYERVDEGNLDAEIEVKRIQLANLRAEIEEAERERLDAMTKLYDVCSILESTQHKVLEARKTLDAAGHAKVIYTAEVEAMRRYGF
jgi:hypothetical protein